MSNLPGRPSSTSSSSSSLNAEEEESTPSPPLNRNNLSILVPENDEGERGGGKREGEGREGEGEDKNIEVVVIPSKGEVEIKEGEGEAREPELPHPHRHHHSNNLHLHFHRRKKKKKKKSKQKQGVLGPESSKATPTILFKNTLKSLLFNRRFMNNLEFAMRQALGVAVASTIALSSKTPILALIPINTVASISPNLGSTFDTTVDVLLGSLIGGALGGTAVALLNEIFVLSHKGGNGDDAREIGARIVAGFLLFLFSFLLAFCSQNYLLIRRSALSTLALALLSSVSQNFDPEAAFTFVEYVFYDSAVAAGVAISMLILPWPRTARSQLVLLLGENLAQEVELLTLLLERCGVTLPDEKEEEEEGRELPSPSSSSSSSSTPSSPPSSPALNITCHEKQKWIYSTPFGKLIEEKEKGRLEKAKLKNKRRQAILTETLGMRRGSTLTHIAFLEQEEKDLKASGEANSGVDGESFQSEYDIHQSQSLRGEEAGKEEREGDTDAETEEEDGIPIPRLRRRGTGLGLLTELEEGGSTIHDVLRTHPEARTLVLELRKRFADISGLIADARRERVVLPFLPVVILQSYFGWHWRRGRLEPSSSHSTKKAHNFFHSEKQLVQVAKSLEIISEHLDVMVHVDVSVLSSVFHRTILKSMQEDMVQIGLDVLEYSNQLFAAVVGLHAPRLEISLLKVRESLAVWKVAFSALPIEIWNDDELFNTNASHMASFGFFFFNFEKALESLCDCSAAITTPEEEKESWFKRAKKLLKPAITDWSLYFKQRISATLKNWKKEQRLENSFRAALCLLLAGLVVLIPYFQKKLPRGTWAAATVGYLVEPRSSGTTLTRALLRAVGTVFGSFAGYLIILFFSFSAYLIVTALALWCFYAGYVRTNDRWSYAGSVAASTAALVVFGFGETLVEAEVFVHARIQATLVGVGIVILLSLVWPDRASHLLQERVSEITHTILDFSTTIFTGFLSGSIVPKTRRDKRIENSSQQSQSLSQSQTLGTKSVKQSIPDVESVPVPTKIVVPKSLNEVVLASKAKTEAANLDFDEKSIIELQRTVEKQRKLLSEAMIEPQLWRDPLPSHSYESIISAQKSALNYLLVAQIGLASLSKTIRNTAPDDDIELQTVFEQSPLFATTGEIERMQLTLLISLDELTTYLKDPKATQLLFSQSSFILASKYQPERDLRISRLLKCLDPQGVEWQKFSSGLKFSSETDLESSSRNTDKKLSYLAVIYSLQHLSVHTKKLWNVIFELVILRFNHLQRLYVG